MSDQPAPTAFGHRRGWSLTRRLREPDSFGLLLTAIALALILVAATGEIDAGAIVGAIALGGTMTFALWTARASRRSFTVAGLSLVLLLAVQLPIGSDERVLDTMRAVLSLAVVVLVMVVVVRRVAIHPVVSGATVAAALCLYLLIGLAFSAMYGLLAAIDEGPLFAGVGDGTVTDRLYFSLVTLTTVGFGDLVAAGDLARMLAVTEALLGQLYLVSVVALLIANLGRERRRSIDDQSSSR